MITLSLNNSIPRTYRNAGQHAEQVVRYTMTGHICKADRKPHWAGGDIGTLQIKTSKATVCTGTDLRAYLDVDGACAYGYVTTDFSQLYVMSRAKWELFCAEFAYTTYESKQNGGGPKMRLRPESRRMLKWLAAN